MSIVFSSFKHLKLPIIIIIPVTIPRLVYFWMTAISQGVQWFSGRVLLSRDREAAGSSLTGVTVLCP